MRNPTGFGERSDQSAKVLFGKERYQGLSLSQKIELVDADLATRFNKLEGVAKDIATRGLQRRFDSWDRNQVEYGKDAIKEIIDDAVNGLDIAETGGNKSRSN